MLLRTLPFLASNLKMIANYSVDTSMNLLPIVKGSQQMKSHAARLGVGLRFATASRFQVCLVGKGAQVRKSGSRQGRGSGPDPDPCTAEMGKGLGPTGFASTLYFMSSIYLQLCLSYFQHPASAFIYSYQFTEFN